MFLFITKISAILYIYTDLHVMYLLFSSDLNKT